MVNRKPDARQSWLDTGLHVLASEGADGLRIDRLATLLGVTKGSFHHHFNGAGGYKKELLAHFERLAIQALDAAIGDVEKTGDAHATLAHLTALVAPTKGRIYWPELEVAIRAWATSDSDVRETQERVDSARLAALQRIWRPHVADDAAARVAALLPYLVAVGATTVVPPVAADELQRVYELLLPLVPSGAEEPARQSVSQR
jgi:AcrR family transcriptional regulator